MVICMRAVSVDCGEQDLKSRSGACGSSGEKQEGNGIVIAKGGGMVKGSFF